MRMSTFSLPGAGFDKQIIGAPHINFVDDQATSWSYTPGDGTFDSSLSVSGFLGAFTTGYNLPACGTTARIHASIVIGGPGLDGIEAAVARETGVAQRTLTGTVTRGGVPAGGVRVHASA